MSVQICKPGLRLHKLQIVTIADAALEHFSRVKGEGAEVDLYGKSLSGSLPAGAVFVLAHEVFLQIEHFEQVVFFNRTATRDELWVGTDFLPLLARELRRTPREDRAAAIFDFAREAGVRLVFSVPREGSLDESLLELLLSWLWHGPGQSTGADKLIASGYLGNRHYPLLLERLELAWQAEKRRREVLAAEAPKRETEIVRVARELGLGPEPTGHNATSWHARCPGGNHGIMISTKSNEFGCGYCRWQGGADELRAFVAERKAKFDRDVAALRRAGE